MNIFIAILGLGLLVLVHEAGHFYTALAVGMRPRRFYVGFPPAVAKRTRRGIEYGIGAIPLGGYVKLPGMHRPLARDVDTAFARPLAEDPRLHAPLERVKANLEEGDMAGAEGELSGVRSALEDAQLSPGVRSSAENAIVDLQDSLGFGAYWRQPIWKRVAVIAAGPGTNVLFAVALFALLFMISGGRATNTVEDVVPDSPAAALGLRSGDRILRINTVQVGADAIARRIQASGGRPVSLIVEREGRVLMLGPPVRPRRDDDRYRLGFTLRGEGVGPVAAVWESVELTGRVTREIGNSLVDLAGGEGREDIASPVGIVQGSSNALSRGLETYLWVLGLISLSLALLNLLPLLPLDGGHIVFSIIEGIRGRAVGREVYERVSAVGIAIVLLLFFVGLSNDVDRLS
jgi:regulator of sigma E protease